MSDYSELKKLAEAATPYKWLCDNQMVLGWLGEEIIIATTHHESGFQMENAAFIAAANPTTVLALIAEAERLERKNDNQAQTIREYSDLVMGGDVSLGMLRADLRVTAGERDHLKTEVEALCKDAERYRWLRDGAGYHDTRDIPGMAPAIMDAFIDNAISRESDQ